MVDAKGMEKLMFNCTYRNAIISKVELLSAACHTNIGVASWAESGLLIEVGIFSPSNVAFLSYVWTKLAEIWYTFNLT